MLPAVTSSQLMILGSMVEIKLNRNLQSGMVLSLNEVIFGSLGTLCTAHSSNFSSVHPPKV